tara:strand:- start:2173 stop:2358 length:186 start_codon:yes stop_codon:yes gene_type:complete
LYQYHDKTNFSSSLSLSFSQSLLNANDLVFFFVEEEKLAFFMRKKKRHFLYNLRTQNTKIY